MACASSDAYRNEQSDCVKDNSDWLSKKSEPFDAIMTPAILIKLRYWK